jgi:hypothetical protein
LRENGDLGRVSYDEVGFPGTARYSKPVEFDGIKILFVDDTGHAGQKYNSLKGTPFC